MNPRAHYEARSKSFIKELRESKQVSYKELARRLEAYGVFMTDQVLINRINRGGFSLTFAMQVAAALGATEIAVPALPRVPTQAPGSGPTPGLAPGSGRPTPRS